jgi:hypothetical protein
MEDQTLTRSELTDPYRGDGNETAAIQGQSHEVALSLALAGVVGLP